VLVLVKNPPMADFWFIAGLPRGSAARNDERAVIASGANYIQFLTLPLALTLKI